MSRRNPLSPRTVGRLRAPRVHQGLLQQPLLADAGKWVAFNQKVLSLQALTIAGQKLPDLRNQARSECLVAAERWMAKSLGLSSTLQNSGPLFVTGHQPEMIHPGVWTKQLAVALLAQRHQGVGLNLIVDNDLAEQQAIRIPAGTREEPHFLEVPFDVPKPRQPWEELRQQRRDVLCEFVQRSVNQLHQWGIDPILPKVWSAACQALNRSDQTFAAITAARVEQERRWGLGNLELPVSELTRTESFLRFVSHICHDPQQFGEIYNRAVQNYRERGNIRSPRHPVPDMAILDGQWEVPFWYWKPGAQDRSRLFLRPTAAGCELIAEGETLVQLPKNSADIAALQELQKSGRLRPRALTTTLYARLILSDLFVHGIGGAKYDEITDEIMVNFFQMEPPEFLTLTATLHLPLDPFPESLQDIRRLRQQARSIEFHPEQFLDDASADSANAQREEILSNKQARSRENPTPAETLHRRIEDRKDHQRLTQLRESLLERVQPLLQQTREEIESAEHHLRANAVLNNREYSALLYPEAELKVLLRNLAAAVNA